MSLFLGKHNNEPLLHSTRNEQSEEQLTAGPNKDTIFHSDLPYILVHDRVDVPMNNSTKTLKVISWGSNKDFKIVVPEGVIPQKIRDYLADKLAYVIVVHRDNRQYTIQPQLSVEPSGTNNVALGAPEGGLSAISWGTGSDRVTFSERIDFEGYRYPSVDYPSVSIDANKKTYTYEGDLSHDHSLSKHSKRVQWWGRTTRDSHPNSSFEFITANIENPDPPDKLEFIFFKLKKTQTGLVSINNSVGDIEVDNKTFRVGDTNILDQEYLVVGGRTNLNQRFVQPLYGMPRGKLRRGYIDKRVFWYATSRFRVPIQTCSFVPLIKSGYGPGTPIGYYQNGHRIEEDTFYDYSTAEPLITTQNKLIEDVEIPKFSIVNSKDSTGIKLENDNITIKTDNGNIDLFTSYFEPRYVIKGYEKISTASVDYSNVNISSGSGFNAGVIRRKIGENEANLGDGKSACIAFVRLIGTRMLDLKIDGKYVSFTSWRVITLKETEGMCGLIEFEDNKEVVVCSYTARGLSSSGLSGGDGQFDFGLRGLISLQKKGSKIEVYNTMYTGTSNGGISLQSFVVRRIQVPGVEVTLSEIY